EHGLQHAYQAALWARASRFRRKDRQLSPDAPTKDHSDEEGHAAVTRPFRAWLLLESCECPWCRGGLAWFQGRPPFSNPSDQLRRRETHGQPACRLFVRDAVCCRRRRTC